MTVKPCLLFDLDGTLSDPIEGIAGAINYALDAFGYDTRPVTDLGRFIGPPLDLTFRELVPSGDEDHIRKLVETFRVYFGRQGYRENRVYEGIPEVVKTLNSQGVPMGICTAKRKDFAERIVRMFGLAPCFDFVSGGDIGIRKGDQIRELLEEHRISTAAVMIGDREGDITAARENGLRSAGVLWGYGTREELAAAGPDWLLTSPSDLAQFSYHIQKTSESQEVR